MLILENIRLAFISLRTGKMRSLLTMLGIIIGIGSVIAIMTVSASLKSSIADTFSEMGASNVIVGVKQSSEEEEVRNNGMRFGAMGAASEMDEEDLISADMIEELKSSFPDEIADISISESVASGTVKSGSNYAYISMQGVNEGYFSASDVTLLAGRRINKNDIDGVKKVIMVSDKVVSAIFDGDNDKALWQKIGIDIDGVYEYYYIVGVYKYESGSSFESSSEENITTSAYIPITTGKEQIHGNSGYSQITAVSSSKVTGVAEFAERIENFFAPYYSANDDYEIQATTMESITDSMNEMIETVTIAIAFIAGISLLVGGIGVMNIMLVSITERTREIGTRKALGARNSSVRLQFIVESVILCLVGGCLGIILGFILGAVASVVLGYSASVPVAAIGISVGFSMVIGLIFGYYPANKAAKMNPIDALRYE